VKSTQASAEQERRNLEDKIASERRRMERELEYKEAAYHRERLEREHVTRAWETVRASVGMQLGLPVDARREDTPNVPPKASFSRPEDQPAATPPAEQPPASPEPAVPEEPEAATATDASESAPPREQEPAAEEPGAYQPVDDLATPPERHDDEPPPAGQVPLAPLPKLSADLAPRYRDRIPGSYGRKGRKKSKLLMAGWLLFLVGLSVMMLSPALQVIYGPLLVLALISALILARKRRTALVMGLIVLLLLIPVMIWALAEHTQFEGLIPELSSWALEHLPQF
jgi:hypothetical protein